LILPTGLVKFTHHKRTVTPREAVSMIVLERETEFVMIKQHDHAYISGEIAKHFRKEFFVKDSFFDEVILAIYEHDRSWIGMDLRPSWNEERKAPYSFMDYPLLPKLLFYKKGLDEVEEMSRYAGLLCSKHYSSFFAESDQPDCMAFLTKEQDRQRTIFKDLKCDEEALEIHFRLLQLCDDLSLYVCLNEPGARKEEEHPWYRNGFSNSEIFSSTKRRPLSARWLDRRRIVLEDHPFIGDFKISLKYKSVSKEAIHDKGMERAYDTSDWLETEIGFVTLQSFGHEHALE
jgi:hypothetical protein